MALTIRHLGVMPYVVPDTEFTWGALPVTSYELLASPQLVSAVAFDSTHVDVVYDRAVKHVSAGNANDALNPSNYDFSVVGGEDITPVSVAYLAGTDDKEFRVEVTEQTDGATYTVVITGVESTEDIPIAPPFNTDDFTGVGVQPQVSSASATDTTKIEVTFSEAMEDNAALVTPANYVIGGYSSITVSSVSRLSATVVELTIPPNMKDGESYTVTVSNVEDQSQNPIDPANNSAAFSGVGDNPELNPVATPIDTNTVEIQYSKSVVTASAIDKDNYQVQTDSNPLALKQWWEFTGTEALHCKAAAENSYDPGAQSFTLVASVELDTNVSQRFFDKTEEADGYRLGTNASGEMRAQIWSIFSEYTDETTGNAIPTGERVIVALRYTNSGGTGPLEALFVDSGGLKSSGSAPTSPFPGNTPELLKLCSQLDGKVRWSAMYFGAALTNVNLDALYAETTHPWDLSPTVYIDYHNLVGSVYQPEVPYSSGSDYYFDVIGTPTRVGIIPVTGDTYRLITEDQESGAPYTITVQPPGVPYPSGVRGLIGNFCIAPDNVATFTGVGFSPPAIDTTPPSDTRDVFLRTPLYVCFYDDAEEFTGIDQSSIWVKLTYTNADGDTQEVYAVRDGDIRPQYTGATEGDPLSADGICYRLLPRSGRWEASTTYTVQSYAEDTEGTSNSVLSTFRTGVATCFEDLLPGAEAIDTQLLTPLAGPNIEKLRQVLLANCSQSALPEVQARTLLNLASTTDLRTTIAGLFDFTLVDGIRLCDRKSMFSVYQALMPYWKHVTPALNEIPNLTIEARQLLKQYTESQSSIYVVNAVAVAVVLAATQTA